MNESTPSKIEDPDHDQPIKSREQDRFGWGDLAEGLARGLTPRSDEPIVIGLYGAWGSGKSSLMNLVEGELDPTPSVQTAAPRRPGATTDPQLQAVVQGRALPPVQAGAKPKVVVVRFNPWFFKGEEALIRAMFVEIAGVLKNKNVFNAENIVKAMRKYVKVLAPVAALAPATPLAALSATAPVVALSAIGASAAKPVLAVGLAVIAVIASAASVVKELLTTVADALDGGPTTLHSEREVLRNLLKESNTRIVVLIDDIDRLHADEMYEMMKLVRLVGDLPNMSYLLAFDDEVVAGCLAEVQRRLKPEESGRGYLEKIVQMSVRVPEPSAAKLNGEALRLLLGVLTARDPGRAEEYDAALETYWMPVFGYHLKGLRQVYRMVNAARVTVALAHESMDLFLIVMAESLRVYSPKLYQLMRDDLGRLLSGSESDPLLSGRKEEYIPTYLMSEYGVSEEDHGVWKDLRQSLRSYQQTKRATGRVEVHLDAAFNSGFQTNRLVKQQGAAPTSPKDRIAQLRDGSDGVIDLLRQVSKERGKLFSSSTSDDSSYLKELIQHVCERVKCGSDPGLRATSEKAYRILGRVVAQYLEGLPTEKDLSGHPERTSYTELREAISDAVSRSAVFCNELTSAIKGKGEIQRSPQDHHKTDRMKRLFDTVSTLRDQAILNYAPLERWLKEQPSQAFREQMTHAKTLKHTKDLKAKLTELDRDASRTFIFMYFGRPGATPERADVCYDELAKVIDVPWLVDHAGLHSAAASGPGAQAEHPEVADALRRFLAEHQRRHQEPVKA